MNYSIDKRIGVLQVIHSLAVGGAENLVYSYAKHHDRSRFRFGVCTFKSGGELFQQIKDLGVDLHCLESCSSNPASFLALKRIFSNGHYDIVHFHNPLPVFWGLPAAFVAGIQVCVLTEHNINYKGRLGKASVVYNQLRKRMDAVLACSEEVRRSHWKNLHSDRFLVVQNGVDIHKFFPDKPNLKLGRDIGLADDSYVIGNIASLTVQKGQSDLLEALKILVSKHLPVILLMVGEGDLRASLESKASQLELTKHVRFLGRRNDVPELLRLMNVVTFSSLWEGLPVSILEAMASSVPVVATDVGGNREVVIDGVTGLLVPPRNPLALASALEQTLLDPKSRRRMGQAGKQLVEKQFSLQRMIAQTEEIYEALISQKNQNK